MNEQEVNQLFTTFSAGRTPGSEDFNASRLFTLLEDPFSIWCNFHAPQEEAVPEPNRYENLKSRTDHPTGASPLFVATGNRSKGKRIAATTISTMLKGAMKEAGFNSERLTAHSLRHTAGTNAMQLTGDLYTTQQYMRHSSPATTEIYLHIDTEQKEAEIAQRLYNHYHGIDNTADSREQLQETIQKMSKEQLEQLAAIAKAICK